MSKQAAINVGDWRVVKHAAGIWRGSIGRKTFAQVQKCGHRWICDILETETGDRVRFGGVWPTRLDALNEGRFHVDPDFRAAQLSDGCS